MQFLEVGLCAFSPRPEVHLPFWRGDCGHHVIQKASAMGILTHLADSTHMRRKALEATGSVLVFSHDLTGPSGDGSCSLLRSVKLLTTWSPFIAGTPSCLSISVGPYQILSLFLSIPSVHVPPRHGGSVSQHSLSHDYFFL
jgi:hypothetical protein